MSEIVFEAPPRSGDNIEDLADAIRKTFGLEDETYFPIVAFVEKGLPLVVEGLEFDVVEASEMTNRMGAVNPVTRQFYIQEDVYDAAVEGQSRPRFTLAHESGHAVMHVGTLNRMSPSAKPVTFRDPEWQANKFAAALLMPRHLVKQCKSIDEIMQRFGVSREAAECRNASLKLGITK